MPQNLRYAPCYSTFYFFQHKYNTNTMFVLHNDTYNNNTFYFFRHKYNTNTMFVLHNDTCNNNTFDFFPT